MRRIDIAGIEKQEIESLLSVLCQAFGSDWLMSQSGHRLQALWGREDALATIELISLGDAIRILSTENKSWVETRIKHIKRDDSTSHGYLFELLGIAMLARAGMKVTPTHGDYPGVDAVITFDDSFKIQLSLKNHDASTHENYFRDRCRKARNNMRKAPIMMNSA